MNNKIIASNGVFNVVAIEHGINDSLKLDDGFSYFIHYDDEIPYIIVNGAVVYLDEFIRV